jgi:hypothetical protein
MDRVRPADYMNRMETEIDSPDAVANQCRYALHGENDDSTKVLYSNTPIPPKVLRGDDTYSDGEYWYPLPSLRIPTSNTMHSWSQIWFHQSAWPGMGLFG